MNDRASLVAQMVKNLPAMQETQVQSLSQEDPLKGMGGYPLQYSASGPITSWQIDGEKVEAVTDFIFLGSKITVDDDCSHEIKRHLLLGRKVVTNILKYVILIIKIIKKQRHYFAKKVHLVKAMVFPVIMYGC